MNASADFDGDEMNLVYLPDVHTQDAAVVMKPHYGIHDQNHPGKILNVAKIPDAVNSTIGNYVNSRFH